MSSPASSAGDAGRLILHPSGRTLECGADETLWQVLRRHDVPIASSCSGDGVCGKCRVRVLSGAEGCSDLTGSERVHGCGEDDRLACQVRIRGAVRITASYW